MQPVFEPGTYSLITANGSGHLVTIDEAHMVVFDQGPTTIPVKGTLRATVLSSDEYKRRHVFEPSLDEQKKHRLQGCVLHYEGANGEVVQVELTPDPQA